MKMPSGLIVQDRKLTHYLLVYQSKDDKSKWLEQAGYTLQDWELLRQDILRAVEGAEILEEVATEWGLRWKVKSRWQGLNGRWLAGITIWQQDNSSETARFVTLYPDPSDGGDSA